jgi:hypothetical protein
MSFLDAVKRLIQGSPSAQKAQKELIRALVEEALSKGDPESLVAAAAYWKSVEDGASLPAATSYNSEPCTSVALASVSEVTSHAELRAMIVEIMQHSYLSGVAEVTVFTIMKQLEILVDRRGGWRDGDLEDVDPGPNVRERWRANVSSCLRQMRNAGEMHNSVANKKTYRLGRALLPKQIEAGPEEPTRIHVLELEQAAERSSQNAWEQIGL